MQASDNKIDKHLEEKAQVWLQEPFDEKTQAQVKEWLKNDLAEIQDGFWKDLEFGTGGMRGLMGLGDSRMNRYTVQRAVQGLCHWLSSQLPTSKRAVIAYDSRHQSKEFATAAAQVLAANGHEVFLFGHLRPTPVLSFAVRYLHAQCGIMVTASHNPPQYNGFKIYDSEGCQVYLPEDAQIVQAVADTSYNQIQSLEQSSLIHHLDHTLDDAFVQAIRSQQRCAELDQQAGSELRLIYSSLHGTGITIAPTALADWGFSQVLYVEAQSKPDGQFPTVTAPNPEDPSALELGIQQLLAHQGDLLIANDPDADRLGVAVRHEGRSRVLNGQEIGVLIADHLLEHTPLDSSPPLAIIKSLVTNDLIEKIAQSKGVACYNVLPGFKFFGRLIRQWEENKKHQFLFGAEESHGYLAGLHARDKDGIVAACLMAEAALICKRKGITLIDRLEQLYQEHGRYGHRLLTLSYSDSQEGQELLEKTMSHLRHTFPQTLGKWALSHVTDLQDQAVHEPLVPANVLVWELQPTAQVILRPSGTESKVKVYLSIHHRGDEAGLQNELSELENQVRSMLR